MATIGQTLGDARREAGLSVEDVAHETHIHANMIDSIEEDDFSKFASVAYARSFIRNYAEFLGVDLGKAMEALDSAKTLRLGEHELMGEMKKTIKKDRRFRLQKNPGASRRLHKPGGAPVFLNIILFALIAALFVFYFLGYKAGSPQEARDEIAKGLQKANPFVEEGAVDLAAASTTAEGESLLPDPLKTKPEPEKKAVPTLQRVDLEAGKAPPVTPPVATPVPRVPDPAETAATSTADEIQKPDVNWQVEESQPAPLAGVGRQAPDGLKPRETPNLKIESEEIPVAPIQSVELPAVSRVLDEPDAALRPEGTDPVPRGGNPSTDAGEASPRALPVNGPE